MFKISATPLTAFQSELTCADGIVGLFKISASPDTAFQSEFTFTSAPVAMPSNFVLSAEDIEPAALTVDAVMEIAGLAPPLETIGAVPVTAVTVPAAVV